MRWAALLLLASQALAGDAGGSWTYQNVRDEMTDGYWHVFTLRANEPISEGILSGVPELVITCGKGFRDSQLRLPVVIGSADVEVRADGKLHTHTWTIGKDHQVFFIDTTTG